MIFVLKRLKNDWFSDSPLLPPTSPLPSLNPQKWAIDLLFKNSRICNHVTNFKTSPSPFCVGLHKCRVPNDKWITQMKDGPSFIKFMKSLSYTIHVLESTDFFWCNLFLQILVSRHSELLLLPFFCFWYRLLLVFLLPFLLLWTCISFECSSKVIQLFSKSFDNGTIYRPCLH